MEPTYLTTHPWLTFSLDLQRMPYRFWMNLGEIRSKCEHIAGVPLLPEAAAKFYQVYLAKGVMATAAIEGNTLREEDVLKHLEGKLEVPPSQEYLKQEIENVIMACNEITNEISRGQTPLLTVETLKRFNAQVLYKMNLTPDVVPGEVRTHSVGVGRYMGAPWQDCDLLLERLCEWLRSEQFRPPTESDTMVFAFLKAIVAHLYIAWIHPFGDGNGRTARLVEFLILVNAGIAQPACHLLSNHYNLTRQEYYRQLDLASRSGGDVLPFLEYAAQGFVDGLRSQLKEIRLVQWDIAWRNFINTSFHNQQSPACQRRRLLALDLGQTTGPIPLHKVPELTPALAKSYANKTLRTVQRDIEELEKMKLVQRRQEGIQANKDLILAFLPWRAPTT